MSPEQQFFQKAYADFSRFAAYGFIETKDGYYYSRNILNDEFKAEIWITSQGEIRGRVFDLGLEAEYPNIHIRNQQGEFVNQVRTAYFAVLQNILEHCFIQQHFIAPQANRLAKWILATFQHKPIFPWEKYPSFGVFKHQNNEKWYALFMHIAKNKLVKKAESDVDVVNIKINPDNLELLLKQQGFYPAYHMNKQHWISIILDDSLPDETIQNLIQQSYNITQSNKTAHKIQGHITEWLIPANPKYFDVEQAFRENSEIMWKQGANIRVGDEVYMYLAAPRSAIMYRCEVLETDIPYHKKHPKINIQQLMKIKLLQQYAPTLCPLSKMKEFGLQGVRGQRNMPKELRDYLKTSTK